MRFIRIIIKFLLFITALTPFIVLSKIPFSFVLGKILFYRSIIEIALILFLIYLLLSASRRIETLKLLNFGTFKHLNFLYVFLFLFLISLIISTIFAVNPYRAFWGDLERGEGLFGFLHFFAFLTMAVAVFEKKDWQNFFKISLGVGFILIFYAFLQYFNVLNFPFLFISEGRPFSFIGNPAFLATHMFFLIMSAVIVFHYSLFIIHYSILKKFWRYFSLLIIILSVATIFITATRGAILGLGAGIFFLLIYFAIKKPSNFETERLNFKTLKFLNIRRISIILLSLIIIFSGTFWLTRQNQFWQDIPGLNRLAKTAIFDVNDTSTQFRLITWKLSWDAFKEKPILGWGIENFLVAYEKHYNPGYAIYGESWMDRAHNKIFDVLVMQGIFGLLTYFGIFGAVFYLLFKKVGGFISITLATLIGGYFIQNLFVMDQIISDIMFFAILGYLIFATVDKSTQAINSSAYQLLSLSAFKLISLSLGLVLIIISGYSLYFYNYIPYVQAKMINEVKGIERASLIENKLREATNPYNFSQFNLRAHIVDYYYDKQPQIFEDASFKPLSDFFVNLIDEIIKKEPYDVRMFIRKTRMLQDKAMNDASLYKEAGDSMKRAIELAPNRQELYYNLAFVLLGQEKFQEAVEASVKAIELNPNVARAHYHLAFVLAVIGPQNADEIIEEMEIANNLIPDFSGLPSGDHDMIALIYSRLNRPDKVAEIIKRSIDLHLLIRFLPVYYEEALGYFAATRDAENFIKLAKDARNYYPHLKDDMDVLIDLAEKGNWEIIDSLSK
ncbi:MAG: O-antigen ligase family protein [Patescibacteria group bacterium]